MNEIVRGRHACPVCAYPELYERPWTDKSSSDEICPSCGTQFGLDDAGPGGDVARTERYNELRTRWIAAGRPWFSSSRKPAGELNSAPASTATRPDVDSPEERTWSWAPTAEVVADRRAEALSLVGGALAAVSYYDIDYFRHEIAPDHDGSREIVDAAEWESPSWSYPDCDSVDFGVELVTSEGDTFSVTWDPPGLREGIGIQHTPLLGSALRSDGDFALWDVGTRSRWTDVLGNQITDVELHYLPWALDPSSPAQAGFWCTRITVSFGDASVVLMLGEGKESGGVAPSADTVAVLFEPIVLPPWEDR